MKEDVDKAALWARSAFDESFLKNAPTVFETVAFPVTTAVQELSHCDPSQPKGTNGAAQNLFTWENTTQHL